MFNCPVQCCKTLFHMWPHFPGRTPWNQLANFLSSSGLLAVVIFPWPRAMQVSTACCWLRPMGRPRLYLPLPLHTVSSPKSDIVTPVPVVCQNAEDQGSTSPSTMHVLLEERTSIERFPALKILTLDTEPRNCWSTGSLVVHTLVAFPTTILPPSTRGLLHFRLSADMFVARWWPFMDTEMRPCVGGYYK